MTTNARWTDEVLSTIVAFEHDDSISVEDVQAKLQSVLTLWEGAGDDVMLDRLDLAENKLENILFASRESEHRGAALVCLGDLRAALIAATAS